ncbi:MAG: hypothetical protein ACL93V_08010 [Candidatus Electrothrix sp. YB6]
MIPKVIAALKYLQQSLAISSEIGDKIGMTASSWNMGLIHKDQGDFAKAELYISHAVKFEERIRHPKLGAHRRTLKAVRTKLHEQHK